MEDLFKIIYHFREEGTKNFRYPITMMCTLLGITTGGYYAWLRRENVSPASFTPRGHRCSIAAEVTQFFSMTIVASVVRELSLQI